MRASASPYTGWAGFYYDAGLPRDKLKEVLIAAAHEGIRRVGLTSDLLDLYDEVDRVVSIRDKRWVLGHIGVLTKEQIANIRDLGLAVRPIRTGTSGGPARALRPGWAKRART